MKKNPTLLIIFFLIVLLSIVGISYALATTSLDIKGTMKMASASWDVHFDKLQEANIMGKAIEIEKPSIVAKGTSINNINIQLRQLSDSVSYTFDVVNAGGLDAELSSYQIADPLCKGVGDNANLDAKMVCDNIKYELSYADGSKLKVGDILYVDEKRSLELKIFFLGTQLPINEVDISNLSIVLSYSQI